MSQVDSVQEPQNETAHDLRERLSGVVGVSKVILNDDTQQTGDSVEYLVYIEGSSVPVSEDTDGPEEEKFQLEAGDDLRSVSQLIRIAVNRADSVSEFQVTETPLKDGDYYNQGYYVVNVSFQ